jgi:DNA-directed RNA polymerase subunit RPC12/RpoP
MGKIKAECLMYKCERCQHTWQPKPKKEKEKEKETQAPPVTCPRCRSPYWNTPRHIDAEDGQEYYHTPQQQTGGLN